MTFKNKKDLSCQRVLSIAPERQIGLSFSWLKRRLSSLQVTPDAALSPIDVTESPKWQPMGVASAKSCANRKPYFVQSFSSNDGTRMMIVRATDEPRIAMVRGLMSEYAQEWPGGEIETITFRNELDHLPGAYAPPRGALLLALNEGNTPTGCVAIRKISADACELKRMFVAPAWRGSSGGRGLLQAALVEAARLGYKRVRLDTLQQMTSARRLYESVGFQTIQAYRPTDENQTVFYEFNLDNY